MSLLINYFLKVLGFDFKFKILIDDEGTGIELSSLGFSVPRNLLGVSPVCIAI